MKVNKSDSEALTKLIGWADRDPTYRRFEVSYKGPVVSTATQWRGGWVVELSSSRRKNTWCRHQCMTLGSAVSRALRSFSTPHDKAR